MRKNAKTLAFNTAANCWPGWGDPGVEIKEEHLQAGLKLAELCRNLVEALNLDFQARATAQWLMGALNLAMGQHADAIRDFQRAKLEYQAGGDSDCVLMAEGYAALARKAQPESRLAGSHELARILQLLDNQSSKEARFFADQIVTADRVLIGANPNA